jgi:alpha-tubulin suppressor-like RCC1 family protein
MLRSDVFTVLACALLVACSTTTTTRDTTTSADPGVDGENPSGASDPPNANPNEPDAGAPRDGSAPTSPLRVVQVALGASHACALLSDGRVKCWGKNSSGELGLGDDEDRGDEPSEMGAALPAVDLGPGRTAKQLALLAKSTCALLDDGSVKCWGERRWLTGEDLQVGISPGQMGAALAPLPLPGKAKSIAAGFQHVCVVLDDDSTRCFGMVNDFGQLGVGDMNPRPPATTLPPVVFSGARKAVEIRPGTTHTCARLDDGSVSCWGDGNDGALGTGTKVTTVAPTSDVDLGAGAKVISLATSAQPVLASLPQGYNCAVLQGGAVKCWGYGSAGLGIGHVPNSFESRGDEPGEMGDDLPAVDLGTGQRAVSVAVGMGLNSYASASCAVLDTGALKCWGYNAFGTLGVGDTAPRGEDVATMGDALAPIDLGPGVKVASVAVSSGYGTRLTQCAVTTAGRLKCWGFNARGQLGLGDTTIRGATPGQMGSALPYVELW